MKFITIILIGLVATLFYFAFKEEAKFNKYLKEHCTIVGEISGSTGIGTGISPSTGEMVVSTVYIPGKTTYTCDNGVFYTR